jgi:WD40 repeat protein
MFRNFLLADRILRSFGCHPVSLPALPPGASDHALWHAWDLACETMLFQLMQDGTMKKQSVSFPLNFGSTQLSARHGSHGSRVGPLSPSLAQTSTGGSPPRHGANRPANATSSRSATAAAHLVNPPRLASSSTAIPPNAEGGIGNADHVSVSSPFFSEQLTAFEVWLDFSRINKMHLTMSGFLESPEQLPIVLQVLLSQVHRTRALTLLKKFLSLGPWAVNMSLSLGIFPYVMKLLQPQEHKSVLISIWASILAFDPTCRADILKDGALHHFVKHLTWGLNPTAPSSADAAWERTLAAFILSIVFHEYPAGQAEGIRLNVHGSASALLNSYENSEQSQDSTAELHHPAQFRLWVCICVANLVRDNLAAQVEACNAGLQTRLAARLNDNQPNVRAAACYGLGSLVGTIPKRFGSRPPSMQRLSSHQLSDLVSGHDRSDPAQYPSLFASGSSAGAASRVPSSFAPLPGSAPLQPIFDSGQSPAPFVPAQVQSGSQFLDPRSQPLQIGLHNGQILSAGLLPSLDPTGQVGLVGGGPLMAAVPQAFQASAQPDLGKQKGQAQDLSSPFVFRAHTSQARTSVFEDQRRLEVDLGVMESILQASCDASVVVRYEAVVALGASVGKYLEGFLLVAEDREGADSTVHESAVSIPYGMDRKHFSLLESVWKRLTAFQSDPFPAVAAAAQKVILLVQDHLEIARQNHHRESVTSALPTREGLTDVVEDSFSPSQLSFTDIIAPSLENAALRASEKREQGQLRRVVTDPSLKSQLIAPPRFSGSPYPVLTAPSRLVPKSKFYGWQKLSIVADLESKEDAQINDPDPLSPHGAALSYQNRRDTGAIGTAKKLAQHFAPLAPKLPNPPDRIIETMLLTEENEEALLAAEEEAVSKKKDLQLREIHLLRNEGVRNTGMLKFHSHEGLLMVCGGEDRISLWDTNTGNQISTFVNGNTGGVAMTSSSWINEESRAKFLVGCDDGTVRIWGDLLEANGEICRGPPVLVSAFSVAPITPVKHGSGLVMEWQPFSRRLIAGGHCRVIRCWDLEAEKMVSELEAKGEGFTTTLTTAWDEFSRQGVPSNTGAGDYQGMSPDVIVAGSTDGIIRVFDIRLSNRGEVDSFDESNSKSRDASRRTAVRNARKLRSRPTEFVEHRNWVLKTAFTGYGGRFALLSGTVDGEIKEWDLRMSQSIRTLEVQRSHMTALAFHPCVPVVAAGSNAQFIKILTLDGDTIQVLRYHGKRGNQHIGPVSCLAFHKYQPLLAAGATDNLIGLLAFKNTHS